MLVDRLTYGYVNSQSQFDPTSHIQSETDLANHVHAFTYDNGYQFKQESDSYPGTLMGTVMYLYDLNGNRTTRIDGSGTDDYVVDYNNKLEWVNRGTTAMPTPGQTMPYMLFNCDLNGNTTHRERRFNDGLLNSFDLYWDGADQLNQVNVHGGSAVVGTRYNGDGQRVTMQDTAGGSFRNHGLRPLRALGGHPGFGAILLNENGAIHGLHADVRGKRQLVRGFELF